MQVLNPQQTHSLLALLSGSDQRSLQSLGTEFEQLFPAQDCFRACCAAVLLLQDNILLKPWQRLALWFVLVSPYKSKPVADNPFISFLVQGAADQRLPLVERTFLLNLLYVQDLQQVAPLSPRHYLDSFTPAAVPPSAVLPDKAELEARFCNKPASTDTLPASLSSWLQPPPATPHPYTLTHPPAKQPLPSTPDPSGSHTDWPQHLPPSSSTPSATPPTKPPNHDSNLNHAAGHPHLGTPSSGRPNADSNSSAAPVGNHSEVIAAAHSPVDTAAVPVANPRPSASSDLLGFERPRPPPLTPPLHELKWLGPVTHQPLVWDAGLCHNTSRDVAVKELIAKALTGPLLPVQQQQVLSHLDMSPKLAHCLGLTPPQLPLLVEHTPVLAYELLRRLVGGKQANEYLAVLAAMDMSLHSMEVVNRLTSATQLPVEFVHLYIMNCITSCEGIQDKNMQSRLVRLVCVFLQNLIKKGAFNVKDLLHEVQAFCINFSRIREAAGLFRSLKKYEADSSSINDNGKSEHRLNHQNSSSGGHDNGSSSDRSNGGGSSLTTSGQPTATEAINKGIGVSGVKGSASAVVAS